MRCNFDNTIRPKLIGIAKYKNVENSNHFAIFASKNNDVGNRFQFKMESWQSERTIYAIENGKIPTINIIFSRKHGIGYRCVS